MRETHRAFGLTWRTDIPWPETPSAATDAQADVLIEHVRETEVASRWSGADGRSEWYLRIDGLPLVVSRGLTGDFLLSHDGPRAHVSTDGSVIAWVSDDPRDPRRLRVLLDTILWSTALLHGIEAVHASAVDTKHGVVAFLSGSGNGKTTLALEFLRRGARLVSDDVLALRPDGGIVLAHPSPPFLNVRTAQAADPDLPIRAIAELGDEAWCVALHPSLEPRPLVQIVLLERAAGSPVELVPAQSPVFELRRLCLTHGLVPRAEVAHFNFCTDLVANVPVSRLRTDLVTSPAMLADLIEAPLTASRP